MAAAKDNTNPNTNNKNDDLNIDNKHANPVTVIVKRIAKNDKIKEFEEWLSGFLRKFLNKKAIYELI